MTTRKKYSKEFKLDAISLVLEQEYTKAEKNTKKRSNSRQRVQESERFRFYT